MAEGTVELNGVCEVLAKLGRLALIVDRQGQIIAANELTGGLRPTSPGCPRCYRASEECILPAIDMIVAHCEPCSVW